VHNSEDRPARPGKIEPDVIGRVGQTRRGTVLIDHGSGLRKIMNRFCRFAPVSLRRLQFDVTVAGAPSANVEGSSDG
jgi:hypothetical protein